MSPLRAPTRSRFAGRVLSLGRVAISITVVAAVGVAGTVAALLPQWQRSMAGAPVAERWFGAYYDVTLESDERLAYSNLSAEDGGVVLAFVVAADEDDCTPTWGAAYSLDDAASLFELDRRIVRLHREGRPVAVSFGGAAHTELAGACMSTNSLVHAYRTVLDRYDLDIVDLDIEGTMLENDAASTRRAAAIARLQSERASDDPLQVWLTLPIAPDGLTADGLHAIDVLLDAGVTLTGVNAMTMNYGITDSTVSMADVSIGALDALAEQLTTTWGAHDLALPDGGVWRLIGATPMIGRNDVATETFTIDDARTLHDFATDRGVARLSMWSLNRDRTCGSNYPFSDEVSNECSSVDQTGLSFASILAEGYDGQPLPTVTSSSSPTPVVDDATTSPYPIWSSTAYYSAGVKVVWNGSVYISKWWNEDGPTPDDPTLDVGASAWVYLGPVLEGDEPFSLPTVPEGTFPAWDAATLYNQGDRVVYNATAYEARWWSQGQRPDRSVLDHDYSPWKLMTDVPASE